MQHGLFGIDRSGALSSRELSGSFCSVSSQGVTGQHGQRQQQQRLKRIPRSRSVQLQLSAFQTGRHWHHQRSACKALCSSTTVSGASSAPDEAAGQAQSPVASTALSNAALRVIFGVLLGCLGAFVIYAGGLLFTGLTSLFLDTLRLSTLSMHHYHFFPVRPSDMYRRCRLLGHIPGLTGVLWFCDVQGDIGGNATATSACQCSHQPAVHEPDLLHIFIQRKSHSCAGSRLLRRAFPAALQC